MCALACVCSAYLYRDQLESQICGLFTLKTKVFSCNCVNYTLIGNSEPL